VNERTTYLTVNMMQGRGEDFFNMHAEHGEKLFVTFLQAITAPIASANNGMSGVYISFVGCIVCFALLLLFLRYITNKLYKARWLLGWSIGSGVVTLLILLYASQVMFLGEWASYYVLENMLKLVSRYGSPYTVGTFMLTASVWMEHGSFFLRLQSEESGADAKQSTQKRNAENIIWLCIVLLGLLMCPWNTQMRHFVTYRNSIKKVETPIREKYSEEFEIIDLLALSPEDKLLYITYGDASDPVLLQYLLSPTPIIHARIEYMSNPSLMEELVRNHIKSYQATALYIDCEPRQQQAFESIGLELVAGQPYRIFLEGDDVVFEKY